MAEDTKIEAHNKKLREAFDSWADKKQALELQAEALRRTDITDSTRYGRLAAILSKTESSVEKLKEKYDKVLSDGRDLFRTGSGKVMLLMSQEAMQPS